MPGSMHCALCAPPNQRQSGSGPCMQTARLSGTRIGRQITLQSTCRIQCLASLPLSPFFLVDKLLLYMINCHHFQALALLVQPSLKCLPYHRSLLLRLKCIVPQTVRLSFKDSRIFEIPMICLLKVVCKRHMVAMKDYKSGWQHGS